LITAAADVALIIDDRGIIRDLAFDRDELPTHNVEAWLGRPWLETVTVESRPKVSALLQDAANKVPPRWRHLNHPAPGLADLPILYSVVQVGPKGRVVAFGRDLRTLASLQQRLVEAQQAMERDYLRMRTIETRYRLIFQATADPVLIVDAQSHKVIEANPSAAALFGIPLKRLEGRSFTGGFQNEAELATLLNEAQAAGAKQGRARLIHGDQEIHVSASLFRQEGTASFLIHLSPTAAKPTPSEIDARQARLLEIIEHAPDGFVVTDRDGAVLITNGAFLELVQVASAEQVVGQSLDRWLGQPGLDLGVLLGNLKEHGTIRLLATLLRSEHGVTSKVELSAVATANGKTGCFGFLIRDVGRRLAGEAQADRQLPRSVEQMTELVGQVPLKDLVRETTDIIERLCIEAALELTGDNRASAAEMLGLSRQSLYVKLRRYGLGDLPPDGEA
jgi:transcriptional regulator PpsR